MLPSFGPSNALKYPEVQRELLDATWLQQRLDFFYPPTRRPNRNVEIIIDGEAFFGPSEIRQQIPGAHGLEPELPATSFAHHNCYLLVEPHQPHLWLAAALVTRSLSYHRGDATYVMSLCHIASPEHCRGEGGAKHIARLIGHMAAAESFQIASTLPRSAVVYPRIDAEDSHPAAHRLSAYVHAAAHAGLLQRLPPQPLFISSDRARIADLTIDVRSAASDAALGKGMRHRHATA